MSRPLSIIDAARATGASTDAIHEWAKVGLLRHNIDGRGQMVFTAEQIDDFLSPRGLHHITCCSRPDISLCGADMFDATYHGSTACVSCGRLDGDDTCPVTGQACPS